MYEQFERASVPARHQQCPWHCGCLILLKRLSAWLSCCAARPSPQVFPSYIARIHKPWRGVAAPPPWPTTKVAEAAKKGAGPGSSSKDDLSYVQYARSTFPLLAAGCAPHLAYLSSLSLDGRAYSGLGWRIFSSPCFHPSGAPTIGHSIGIFVVLDTDVSTQCHTLCYYSLSSIQYLASSIL